MSEMEALPEGWSTRVEAYLDRVERALLTGGVARGVRRHLLERLGDEVTRRVASARQAGAAKPEDLEKVLSALDSGPAADLSREALPLRQNWRENALRAAPRRSKCAFWGAVCIALSLLPMVAILLVLSFFSPSGPHILADFPHDRIHAEIGGGSVPSTEGTTLMRVFSPDGYFRALAYWQHPLEQFWWMLVPISPFALAGTLLGWISFLEIGFSKGQVTGRAVALFDSLFYPILLGSISFCL